jgi:hypothetical protein
LVGCDKSFVDWSNPDYHPYRLCGLGRKEITQQYDISLCCCYPANIPLAHCSKQPEQQAVRLLYIIRLRTFIQRD